MKNKEVKKIWVDIPLIIIASLIYSFAVHTFTVPNDIAPGGVTGIATVLNHLTGFPVGLAYGIMNLPLIIIGFFMLKKGIMFKTFLSIAVFTATTDYLFTGLPVYEGDRFLAALYGGLLIGFGLGIIFARDATSGGMDIVSRLIRRRLPYISLGKIIIMLDFVVVTGAMLVFGSIDSGLYAIISIFVSSKVVDLLLYGTLEGKMLLIFSDSYDEIADKILREQQRGVTLLKGYGGYSRQEKNVICCAVQKNRYVKIKNIVYNVDPEAFIIITNAGEVFGKGFSENRIDN